MTPPSDDGIRKRNQLTQDRQIIISLEVRAQKKQDFSLFFPLKAYTCFVHYYSPCPKQSLALAGALHLFGAQVGQLVSLEGAEVPLTQELGHLCCGKWMGIGRGTKGGG